MEIGIVGLPNVGKSSIFNALTEGSAACSNYPFTTIEPNVGIVAVPDKRLDRICEILKPAKTTPAAIRFVDIAGLVEGASKGEGLGNKFLSHIREVDAVVHIVRCFSDSNITHISGSINPSSDIEIINLELIFADIETLEKRLDKTKRLVNAGEKKSKQEYDLLAKIKHYLEENKPVRTMDLSEEDDKTVKELNLLTVKPVLYVLNIDEKSLKDNSCDNHVKDALAKIKDEKAEVIRVSAKVEAEIAQLSNDERKIFLEELGIKQSGLDTLIRSAYNLLGLITFFTVNENEGRAWTIKSGAKVPQAAGIVHTDFEKNFIKAEVINAGDLDKFGSLAAAREKGLIRSEGREYVVKDGDLIYIRHG